jgi:hypothetical protein
VRARLRNRFQKIGQRRKARGGSSTGCALAVERAVSEKGELRTMVCEFVHLPVVQLVRPDHLRRAEQPPAAITKAAIGRERRVLGEPTGDCRRHDAVAEAG